MPHIYRELHEIPIPTEGYINHSDGRVFTMSDDGLGNKKRKVIGHATSETTMHPNDLFNSYILYYGKIIMGTGTSPSMNSMQGCMQ